MPSSGPLREPARSPDELNRRRQDAINGGDLDGYLDVHEDDAVVVVPTDGTPAHGRRELRAAMASLFALEPTLTTTMTARLGTADLTLSHHRWHLWLVEGGCQADISGLGTMVSRRRPDGTWRIVLDDAFTGA